jgi:RNA polymerase sigma-70 factor (ECF subfamily)
VWAAYRPRIYAFLARMTRSRPLAEDLLQETFLRLAARAPGLADDTRLGAWLFTVARNLMTSHYRATLLDAERTFAVALAGEARAADAPTPFDEASAGELGRRLERAVAALPPAYREVVLLVAVERLDHADAARVLQLKPEAFRQRLARARALLDDALAEPPRTAARRMG